MLEDVVGRALTARALHDEREGTLVPGGMTQADHRGLAHRRVLPQHALDLAGRDVLAPGDDHVIDSPGDDTFVGGTPYSYMYSTDIVGNFNEFNTAYGFALVFGESFVGGTDTAINNDPTKNIVSGFHR